jgi:hypothetical protein
MTRLEKIELAIEKGYTYNPETGQIFNISGKEIICKLYGYIKIALYDNNRKYHTLLAHQLAWYVTYNEIVDQLDHINGIRDDNSIINLRSVTPQQNQQNQTKAKGYYWNKQKQKFLAQIAVNRKKIHLGYFDLETDAHNAYLNAKTIYHKF